MKGKFALVALEVQSLRRSEFERRVLDGFAKDKEFKKLVSTEASELTPSERKSLKYAIKAAGFSIPSTDEEFDQLARVITARISSGR